MDVRASLDPIEQEANYGSACLLAPQTLLTKEFAARFHIGPPLPPSDAVIFDLCGESGHALMRSGDTMKFAIAVATTPASTVGFPAAFPQNLFGCRWT